MEAVFATIIENCQRALDTTDPRGSVELVLKEAVNDPEVAQAISRRTRFASLEDLALHRSKDLTILAGCMPPGFSAGPHNHNLWSVVGACAGQEDNEFFERDGKGLRHKGAVSLIGPGVMANDADVIHAIRNPLDTPLLALHAYGGDLFATVRSTWDAETHEETVFDWQKVAGT